MLYRNVTERDIKTFELCVIISFDTYIFRTIWTKYVSMNKLFPYS